MARIVSAYAVPHTPSFVATVAQDGAEAPVARFFTRIKEHLDHANVSALLMIQNDHFNTFFFDNWPAFAIGIADQTWGPSDQTPAMPDYDVPVARALANHIHVHCVDHDFDLASSQAFDVDHGVLVPLHFLMPGMTIPIVPVFVNCFVPPLPRAKRCHALGQALKAALESWTGHGRVAVIASGSLSLEIGGPLMEPGKTFGVPDPAWAAWILDRVRTCEHEELIEAAVPARMAQNGNAGGELLNWITLLGITGTIKPDILINQPELGNAFAAWTLPCGGAA